jgi:nitrogenase molybdenum-iron protein alpha/beta subunit
MKSTTIISGNFAKSAGSKGNFTGYNTAKQQIFIPKAMIENLNIKKDADFKQPIYALIDERIITPWDENGQPLAPVVRLEALCIFATPEELITAKNADAKLAIMERQDLETTLSSANLTEASVNAILSASSLF